MHGLIETDDGGFGFRAQHLFGEEDAKFAKLGKHGIDARAGFDNDDDGKRIATYVEVSEFLRNAIVGDEEVLLIEIVNHGAAEIADGNGRGDEGDAGGEFVEDFRRGLLDLSVGAGSHGAFGSLSK